MSARAHEIAAGQLVDLAGQHLGALDARLLLGGAGRRARAQPLGLAAQGIAQRSLAPLLRDHQISLAFDEGGVVTVDGKQPARIAPVEFQNAIGHPLQEQPIVRDGHGGKGRRGQQLLQPQDAVHVQVVGRLVEQQQFRLAHKLARQRHPLAPAA